MVNRNHKNDNDDIVPDGISNNGNDDGVLYDVSNEVPYETSSIYNDRRASYDTSDSGVYPCGAASVYNAYCADYDAYHIHFCIDHENYCHGDYGASDSSHQQKIRQQLRIIKQLLL